MHYPSTEYQEPSKLTEFAARQLARHADEIESWFRAKLSSLRGPLYASCDIRNGGFKTAPVDTNLYPGGFNNLSADYRARAAEAFRAYFRKESPLVRKILFLPENHTRNPWYLSNVKALQDILESAGFEVRLGLLDEMEPGAVYETSEGARLTIEPVYRVGERLAVSGFKPDAAIVNNDFSAGVPQILRGAATPLLPSPNAGWHFRRKSSHFSQYEKLMIELCSRIGLDPWLFSAYFDAVGAVDFKARIGIEEIAERTDALIDRVAAKYREYNIKQEPFVFIKNDQGTYGMSVVPVHSGREVLEMNKRNRTRMQTGKNGQPVRNVILQEGIPTVDRFNGLVSESVVYMVGNQVVGGFSRVNGRKGDRENLNANGMEFRHLALDGPGGAAHGETPGAIPPSCAPASAKFLARMASLAAGHEMRVLELVS